MMIEEFEKLTGIFPTQGMYKIIKKDTWNLTEIRQNSARRSKRMRTGWLKAFNGNPMK